MLVLITCDMSNTGSQPWIFAVFTTIGVIGVGVKCANIGCLVLFGIQLQSS